MKTIKNKGITLIALVVTIIVLLILAGISIAMLTGEGGILNRAKEANEKTEMATEKEQRQLAMYEASMNISGMTFQGVEIPAGFAPTRIAGESTVDEGLVIIDSKGNEFVWIPCEYDEESAEVAGVEVNEDTVYYNNDDDEKGDNRDTEWQSKQWCYNGGEWYDSQPKNVGEDSIKAHHGFYVARYEAGVPEEASFYVSEDMSGEKLTYTVTNDNEDTTGKNKTEDNGKKLAPVSKKGNQAWNFISQTNAVTVAGNMVKTADVKSCLIDSHAWNTICRLIKKRYKTEDVTKVTNSTKWGNYYNNTTTKYEKLKSLWALHSYKESTWAIAGKYTTGTIPSGIAPKGSSNNRLELATGVSEDFKAYNIYDLAGNMFEWTTETGKNPEKDTPDVDPTCTEDECPDTVNAPHAVRRGGSFDNSGSGLPVVHANGGSAVGDCSVLFGFRVVLYLQ